MSAQDIVRPQDGHVYACYLTAAQPLCGHCKKSPRPNEPIHCVGAPYHTLLHRECFAFFDYEEQRWPHAGPVVSYTKPRVLTNAYTSGL